MTIIKLKGTTTIVVDLERVLYRMLVQALLDAIPGHWRRRAQVFEAAKPQPDDYNGGATNAELAERWRRCDEIAQACRDRATMIENGWTDGDAPASVREFLWGDAA